MQIFKCFNQSNNCKTFNNLNECLRTNFIGFINIKSQTWLSQQTLFSFYPRYNRVRLYTAMCIDDFLYNVFMNLERVVCNNIAQIWFNYDIWCKYDPTPKKGLGRVHHKYRLHCSLPWLHGRSIIIVSKQLIWITLNSRKTDAS